MKSLPIMELILIGFYLGTLIFSVLISSLFFLITKSKTILLFSLYTLCLSLHFGFDNLELVFDVKPTHYFLVMVTKNLIVCATSILSVLYAFRFLKLESKYTSALNIIIGLIIIRILVFLTSFSATNSVFYIQCTFDVAVFLVIIYLGIITIRSNKSALFFVIGFTFHFLAYLAQITDGESGIYYFQILFLPQLLFQTWALFLRFKDNDMQEDLVMRTFERKRSYSMLMDILDFIPHQIFLKDHNHKLILLNKRVADIHNLKRENLVGKSDFELFDKDIAQKYFDEEKEMIKSGIPKLENEFIHYGKNGEVHIFNSLKQPFYVSDMDEHGLLGIEIEITESKKLEKKLTDQKNEIETQKKTISDLLENVTESIQTAKMIQKAIMPTDKVMAELFHEYFVLYMPKDIVSGDFYWLRYPFNSQKILFATVDCTGHGVAGAFISLIAHNLLNKIVDSGIFSTPAAILDKLNSEMMLALNQGTDSENGSHDGMDITLCMLDLQTLELEYAGACSQFCLVRNNEVLLYKTEHFSIGYLNNIQRNFTNYKLQLKESDALYIYSDGYADQFGGNDGLQKYKYNRLRNLLLSLSGSTMSEQKQLLKTTFEEWRGTYEQTDDVMMIGLKF